MDVIIFSSVYNYGRINLAKRKEGAGNYIYYVRNIFCAFHSSCCSPFMKLRVELFGDGEILSMSELQKGEGLHHIKDLPSKYRAQLLLSD